MNEKESFEHTPDVLDWRDLSGDEVYHIAHLEDEARNAATELLSKAAFSVGTILEDASKAQGIIDKNDTLALSWLHSQAYMKDMSVAPVAELKSHDLLKEVSFKDWLNNQMEQLIITGKELALEAGISEGYVSGIKRGTMKPPSNKVIFRLITVFGNKRGLEGDELKEFIISNANSLGIAINNI